MMQPYHPFFSNIPPPPLPTREFIINEGLKVVQQPKIDQEWLKNWITRKKEEKQLSSNRISLFSYRQQLIQHAHLLQQYEDALKISNHEVLLQLKLKIEQSNNFIYDSHIVKNIQKQIHRRKSKRARLRRQKQKQPIATGNSIINEQPSNEKSLLEKIQDVNSLLHTIKQLKRIRLKRLQDNINTIATNNTTEDELTEIENLCTDRLNEYKAQTKKQTHKDLLNYLFNNHDRSFYESTNPDGQYYLRAHQNKTNLVQIRQAWDQYSTTRITSLDNIIPSQWYEPHVPCDANWARYIFHRKE